MNTVVHLINSQWGCEAIRLLNDDTPTLSSLLWDFVKPNLVGNMVISMLLDDNNDVGVQCMYTGLADKYITLEIGYTNDRRRYYIPYE